MEPELLHRYNILGIAREIDLALLVSHDVLNTALEKWPHTVYGLDMRIDNLIDMNNALEGQKRDPLLVRGYHAHALQ